MQANMIEIYLKKKNYELTFDNNRTKPKLLKSYVLLFWKNIYQNLGRNKKI